MARRTPAQWFEQECSKAQLFDLETLPYWFTGGNGHVALLAMADGLRALQVNCLAIDGRMVVLSDEATP